MSARPSSNSRTPPGEEGLREETSLVISDVTLLAGMDLEPVEHAEIGVSSGRIGRAGRADTVIDGRGLIAMPGLVNGHIHLNDAPLKDLGVGLPMDELIHPVSGLKRKGLESIGEEARLEAMSSAVVEMVRGGITTAVNFHEEGSGIIRKLLSSTELSKVLVNLCRPATYFDQAGIERNEPYAGEEMEKFASELRWFQGAGLSGTNEYSDSAMEQVSSAVAGLKAIHAAESGAAAMKSMRMTGQTEVERAIAHLSPDMLVHMTHAGREDIELASAEKVSVVFCPRSNAILGNGMPKVREVIDCGIPAGLGTDNLMFNAPDMFREMDYTSRMLRGSAGDPSKIGSLEVLRMATSSGAVAAGLGGRRGAIADGYDADIILLDAGGRLAGTHDIHSSIVHRATVADVAGTIRGGRFLHRTDRIRVMK